MINITSEQDINIGFRMSVNADEGTVTLHYTDEGCGKEALQETLEGIEQLAYEEGILNGWTPQKVEDLEDDGCSNIYCDGCEFGEVSLQSTLDAVIAELQSASNKFPPFNSSHEGFAVLKEEVDELWDSIKANDQENARTEAVQVAAMALRYLLDC